MADWNTIVAESLNTGQPRGLIIASENPAPRPPRTGPKRPGQQLSRPWRGQARQARDDQPVADGNQLDDPPAAQQSSHAQKMQQQDEDWNRERLGLCSRALGHAPLHASMQELRLRQRQQQVEELLSAACLFHCCSTPRAEAEGVAHDQALDQLPPRQAVYYSFDHRFTIQVPRWHCKQCNIDFEPQPQDVNCWPSTVAQPFRWFDLDMMHMYKHLGLRLGVSATGFLDTCHLQQERYGAVEAAALAGGDPVPARTDSHQFMQSFMAYLGVHTDLASLTGLGLAVPDDPLSACPVCADVPAEVASPVMNVSIAADVVTKPGHYSRCGQATQGLQPRLSIHYGAAQADALKLHEDKQLNLAVLAPTNGVARHGADQACCRSELTCANEDSQAAGSRDIFGVLGASCAHGFPVRGSFIDLHAPENFSYYLIMLMSVLVAASGRIYDVYVDFGCRLAITWQRFLEYQDLLQDSALARIRMVVNWLHAAGHNLSCQLQNSARHTDDAAWRVGEHQEQLWSLIKPVAKQVRYMNLANRRDYLDAALVLIGEIKLRLMPELLGTRAKRMLARKKELQAKVDKLTAAAITAGVADLVAAQKLFKEHTCKLEPTTETGLEQLKVEYVHLLSSELAHVELASATNELTMLEAGERAPGREGTVRGWIISDA